MKEFLALLIPLALFSLILSFSLNLSLKQVRFLEENRALMGQSLLAVNILTPIAALFILFLFKPAPEISMAIALMATAPGAPLAFSKSIKAKANISYGASLQLVIAFLTVITTPITLALLSPFLNSVLNVATLEIEPLKIFKQVAVAQLIPLILGVFLREKNPQLADKLIKPLSIFSRFIFLVLQVLILIKTAPAVLRLGLPSLLLMSLVAAAALFIGHRFGGSNPEDRATLALINVTRNPGLALLIAQENLAKEAILLPIIAFVLTSTIMGIVYQKFIYKTHKS